MREDNFFFSFENASSFFRIPLIRYEQENIVCALQFHDKTDRQKSRKEIKKRNKNGDNLLFTWVLNTVSQKNNIRKKTGKVLWKTLRINDKWMIIVKDQCSNDKCLSDTI